MTDEELIEQVAHVLCETGAAASWVPAVQSAYAILPIIKAEVDKWRNAVIDELTSLHIYNVEHDADPRKAVRDIVKWSQRLALDPAVSAEARALMVRGGEMVKEAAAITAFGSLNVVDAGDRIRALSVPAIVEAGDG